MCHVCVDFVLIRSSCHECKREMEDGDFHYAANKLECMSRLPLSFVIIGFYSWSFT
jgi:hypothetical protein